MLKGGATHVQHKTPRAEQVGNDVAHIPEVSSGGTSGSAATSTACSAAQAAASDAGATICSKHSGVTAT